MVKKPPNGFPTVLIQCCLAVSVSARVEKLGIGSHEARAPFGGGVLGPHEQAQMAVRLRRDHPPAECLREFAVNIDPGDTVIQGVTVSKPKLAVQVDFDELSTLRPFRIVKLVPPIAPSSLAVVKLVEGVSQHLRYTGTLRIKLSYRSIDGVQFGVNGGLRSHLESRSLARF